MVDYQNTKLMRNVLPPMLQISRRIMIDLITAPFSNWATVCHQVRCHYHEDHTEAHTYTWCKMCTKPKWSHNKDGDEPTSRHCMLKAQEDTHHDAGYHAQDIMSRLGKLKTGLTMALFLAGVYAHAMATITERPESQFNMCMLQREQAGAPLLQYLDQATASWENVSPDELYVDQDVWEPVVAPSNDVPMKEWMVSGNSPGYQQEYLRELLRLEAHEGVTGEVSQSCSSPSDDERD
ncbi:hypothetical protein EDD85DRAFT_791121 [Armillaria nabsnona]|nr:hypothetical protein EDD85DRAFT_791121 [Armillaria nabsnona]